jgi:hypothetical protein
MSIYSKKIHIRKKYHNNVCQKTDNIIKTLSKEGYFSESFENTICHILDFHRTITLKDNILFIRKLFYELNVRIEVDPIIFYPSYMKSLYEKFKNPYEYYVVYISKNIQIPVRKIQTWIDFSREYYKVKNAEEK